jgi:hypothetical protein
MQFDYSHDPADDPKLSPATAEMMRQTRAQWRRLGLSVQFLTDRGTLDEWSFRTAAARDAFIAQNLAGKTYALSAAS